ncbi:hypothetical protein [Roseibacillus persicicus]|uniref:Uncharacterized protein n=1 Tax=Roseibacillus persicicus TaxID=454148 RepID=A0A918TKY8_9BACT|nr:hypothetical protein [Roseibacillus persicicus]GHC46657.1 hypothetical protein GCM10007100_10380 [Roseibacillus persicicus]
MLKKEAVSLAVLVLLLGFTSCDREEAVELKHPAKSATLESAALAVDRSDDWRKPDERELEKLSSRLLEFRRKWLEKLGIEEEELDEFYWKEESREFDLELSAGERKELLLEILAAANNNESHPLIGFIYPMVCSWAREDPDEVLVFLDQEAGEWWLRELRGEIRVGQALAGDPEKALLEYENDRRTLWDDEGDVSDEIGVLIMELWARQDGEAAWNYILETVPDYNYLTIAYITGLSEQVDWVEQAARLESYFEGKYTSEEPLALLGYRWMKADFEPGRKWFEELASEDEDQYKFEFCRYMAESYYSRKDQSDAIYPLFQNLLAVGDEELVIGAIGFLNLSSYVSYDRKLVEVAFGSKGGEFNAGLALVTMRMAVVGHAILQVEPTLEQREFFGFVKDTIRGTEIDPRSDAGKFAGMILANDFDRMLEQSDEWSKIGSSEPTPQPPVVPMPVDETDSD